MKRKTFFILAAVVSILLLLAACDQKGDLTQKEVQQLHAELQEDVRSGKLWNDEKRATYFHSDEEIEDNFIFLKTCVTEVLVNTDNEQFENEYGIWFSRRSYCKSYVAICSIQVQYNDADYTITELHIAKYYSSGGYKIWIYYTNNASGTSHYIEAAASS